MLSDAKYFLHRGPWVTRRVKIVPADRFKAITGRSSGSKFIHSSLEAWWSSTWFGPGYKIVFLGRLYLKYRGSKWWFLKKYVFSARPIKALRKQNYQHVAERQFALERMLSDLSNPGENIIPKLLGYLKGAGITNNDYPRYSWQPRPMAKHTLRNTYQAIKLIITPIRCWCTPWDVNQASLLV